MISNIYSFDDYKAYVQNRIQMMPKGGRGQYLKMSEFLKTSSVAISQIFRGNRDLSLEQAWELNEFFGHSPIESQYFLCLVEIARASTFSLKKEKKRILSELRERSQDLKNRIAPQQTMSEEARAIFYSQWQYSGIRLLSSLPGSHTVDSISQHFGLSAQQVGRIVDFLVEHSLCKIEKGKIQMGTSVTYIEASHPLVTRHHSNWRLKSISRLEKPIDKEELFLTMPCSLAKNQVAQIRQELVNAIEKVSKKIDEGPEETLACLNIDWFKF